MDPIEIVKAFILTGMGLCFLGLVPSIVVYRLITDRGDQ